jgi:5-methylcytosine-specific restriction endonuclease McrA
MKVSREEIEAERTPAGGWNRETLERKWRVPWPPPKGWKQVLEAGGRFNHAEIHAARKQAKSERKRSNKKPKQPRFRGRWKGRLVYHWKRSPAKFNLTSEFLDELWIKQEGRCAYCEVAIDDETLVIEHMTPLSRGGRTDPDNVCFACHTCNGIKSAMPFEAWCQRIGWEPRS